MPAEVDWPNPLADIIVLSWPGPGRRQFTIRPRQPGLWRLLVWPTFHVAMVEPTIVDLRFHAEDDLAQTIDWSPPAAMGRLTDWSWKLIRVKEKRLEPLSEMDIGLPLHRSMPVSDMLLKNDGIIGRFKLFELAEQAHGLVLWSCHQPYEGSEGEAPRIVEGTRAVLDWYVDRIADLAPDVVYGLGDTAYSDGCPATNFVDHYYSRPSHLKDPDDIAALRREYQRMYRHHWSFKAFQIVQKSVPHICIWDDHELRDGSGSEAEDREGSNPIIREVATAVANAYILDQGPRVRGPDEVGADAHKAYRFRSIASFIFDGRSGREYHGTDGKVISDTQMRDFEDFCDRVAEDSSVKYLLLGTAVPFINVKDFVEKLGSKAPKLVTDAFAGIRDDVRDSWHSPGNRAQLEELLGIVRRTLSRNDDCIMVNLSGDIHVSNAFSFTPPRYTRACYQFTSSALTNRSHLPSALGELLETGTWDFSSSLGIIHRIWKNVRLPNFLYLKERAGLLDLHLNVFDPNGETSLGELDQRFTLGRERFGLRRALIA